VVTLLTRIHEVLDLHLSQNIGHRGFSQLLKAYSYAGILPRLGHHLIKILSKLAFIIITIHLLDTM
jgi:hypothetical protein